MFQELPSYYRFIQKPKNKSLKNIDLLHELTFYDKLNIYQMLKAFGWYSRSSKAQIIDSKGPLAQLETNKSSIKY